MSTALALAVAFALALAGGSSGGAARAASDGMDVEDLLSAIVRIAAVDDAGAELWHGSGTIIDPDGLVLTNAHVADDLPQPDGSRRGDLLGIQTTHRPELPPTLAYWATVVAIDYPRDLAVLRIVQDQAHREIEPRSLSYLRLGGDTALGETITILGYPGIGGDTISLSRGEISGYTGDPEFGDRSWIKTSATIAGGNSGGAAVNDRGELIGIPTRVGAGEIGRTVDCRPLADTNGDGRVDDADTCIPVGGFFNELRPVAMARPLVDAARAGRLYRVESSDDAEATPAPGVAFDPEALAALLGGVDDRVVSDCTPASAAAYGGGTASIRCEPADAPSDVDVVFLDSFPDETTMVATFDRLVDGLGAEACAPDGPAVDGWDHPSGRVGSARFFCYRDDEVEGLVWSEPAPGLLLGTALGDDRSGVLEWWRGHRPAVAVAAPTTQPAPSVDEVAVAALIARLDERVLTGCVVSDLAPFRGALAAVQCDPVSGGNVSSVYVDGFPDEASMQSTFRVLSEAIEPVPCVEGAPEIVSYTHPAGRPDAARYFCAEGESLDSLTWIEPAPGLVLATVYGPDTASVLEWWQDQPYLVAVESATPEPTAPPPSPAPSGSVDQVALASLLDRVDATRVSDCVAAQSAPYRGGLASVQCGPSVEGTGVTDVYLDSFPDEATMGATFDRLVTSFDAMPCVGDGPVVGTYDHPSGDADLARYFCYPGTEMVGLVWAEPEPGLVIGTALGPDADGLLAWWDEQPAMAAPTPTGEPTPEVDEVALAALLERADPDVVSDCRVAPGAAYRGALVSIRCETVDESAQVAAVYLDAFPDEPSMRTTFDGLVEAAEPVSCGPGEDLVGTWAHPSGDDDAARFFCERAGPDESFDHLLWSEPAPGLVIGTALGDDHQALFEWWEANRPAVDPDR